jgi:DNA-binding transcriptional ArsR family regulator
LSYKGQKSLEEIESELKGKSLRVYWYLLKQANPVGIREVQRALGFSSPSIANHHLEKLMSLGLIEKDEYGRYLLKEYVNVGVLQSFTKIGKFLLPRYSFYASFFTTLLIVYIYQYARALNVFAFSSMFIATIIFWYETISVWRRKPY